MAKTNNFLPTDQQIEAIARLAASPEIKSINDDLDKTYKKPSDRAKAEKIANLEEFKKRGGLVNKDLRISLRDFERPDSKTKNLTNINFDILEKLDSRRIIKERSVLPKSKFSFPIPKVHERPGSGMAKQTVTICASIGIIVCVSVGGDVDEDIPKSYDLIKKFDNYVYYEAKNAMYRLKDFAAQKEFQDLLRDMYSLPAKNRNAFVKKEVISKEGLKKRKIVVPLDIIVQRSAFSDNRPTLFSLTKYLSDGQRKMTITFDS